MLDLAERRGFSFMNAYDELLNTVNTDYGEVIVVLKIQLNPAIKIIC